MGMFIHSNNDDFLSSSEEELIEKLRNEDEYSKVRAREELMKRGFSHEETIDAEYPNDSDIGPKIGI